MQTAKYQDDSWDFRNSDTKQLTHGFHAYPAMMIPQIAQRLLGKYGADSNILFDPYCGSGTSLVEANLNGIDAIGTDLNPLARLIATTKTTPIDIKTLDLYLEDFNRHLFSARLSAGKLQSADAPSFDNIDFWFTKKAQQKLAQLKAYIDQISEPRIKNFFLTAFSVTVRESSLTKKGEFKLVRMPPEKRAGFDPDSFGIMLAKLMQNRTGILDYIERKKNSACAQVHAFNTVDSVPDDIIPANSIDIVITSPPYGDSQTTVAYGQYSRLANQWMGLDDAAGLDKRLMGGVRHEHLAPPNSECLLKTLEKIDRQDAKRGAEVESFFCDYKNSIDNVSNAVKKNGVVCYVVGNRTVKDINIPMDEITKDFFAGNNFEHLETIIRNIPNKRMPSKNSPSNIRGKKSSTMKNEFIVVCEKQS